MNDPPVSFVPTALLSVLEDSHVVVGGEGSPFPDQVFAVADVDQNGGLTSQFQHLCADQAIMQYDICPLKGFDRLEREQIRITGSCADKIDVP